MYDSEVRHRKQAWRLIFTYFVIYFGAVLVGNDSGLLAVQNIRLTFLSNYFPSETLQFLL